MLEVMDDMLKVMTAHVTVRPSSHEFAVEGHATLLQAGLHAGLKLNYGCGNGSCGMCKVRVISGEVAQAMGTGSLQVQQAGMGCQRGDGTHVGHDLLLGNVLWAASLQQLQREFAAGGSVAAHQRIALGFLGLR